MTARMTISVPEKLKAEMDADGWTNWSSVAQRAFALHLKIHKEMDEQFRSSVKSDRLDKIKRQLITELESVID